jgi:sugar phosphate isomerase/epimerase
LAHLFLITDLVKALQSPRATVRWAPCDTRKAVLSDASLYNVAGAKLAEEGITVCRHHHVKDLYGLEERGQFTVVGIGVVNVRDSVQIATEIGIEWVVIEQDTLRNLTAFETITVSYLNLKEAGLV